MSSTLVGNIAVLGAGSWGTALAMLLARNGHATRLWVREAGRAEVLARGRVNEKYLPGFEFPPALSVGSDLAGLLDGVGMIIIAVPSHAFRPSLQQIAGLVGAGTRIAWATKGFDPGTGKLMSQVIEDLMPASMSTAAISGPTFATEVARGLPTAVTVASLDQEFAGDLAQALHNKTFRVYTTDDLTGVQFGGAVKNVFALAAGITDGLGFGANARAALIARALAEMIRLGTAWGGRRETFMGLAGIGDLVLTCTDDQSRNRRVGMALGRGRGLDEALREVGQVVEGVGTVREVMALAEQRGIELPITQQVYRVLYDGLAPRQAAEDLLMREQRPEAG